MIAFDPDRSRLRAWAERWVVLCLALPVRAVAPYYRFMVRRSHHVDGCRTCANRAAHVVLWMNGYLHQARQHVPKHSD